MYWKFCLVTTCLRLTLTYCEIIAPSTEGKLDWWQNAIIYEIFPLSFKDSNSDGLGDFKGITQKLDYLVDLDVTAIWLTPFFKSPFQSGGYDISNYFDVQDVFGTLNDLKELINNAHKRNLKVIMDFVPNHTSDEHDWFKKSVQKNGEFTDYYIWKDAKNQKDVMKNSSVIPIAPNNWKRLYGKDEDNSAWIWHSTRKQFYFTQFIPNLPDLNFRNQKIHEEMKKILSYWIELGIDGIRIDALKHVYENENMKDEPIINPEKPVNYNNLNHDYTIDQIEIYDLIHEWHLLLEEFKQKDNKSRIIMTESYSPHSVLFKYYTSGAEIPSNFFLMSNNNMKYTPKDFNREIKKWITEMPQGATYNSVFQNHDSRRFPTLYGDTLIDGLNALSLFLPGVAIIYYGGEIGMEDISDQFNLSRGPMQWDNTTYAGFTNNTTIGPWISVHSDYVERNVLTENEDPKSYLNFFRSVSKLRRTKTFKRGGLATYIFNDTVFVLNRFLSKNENYTLVINMDSDNTQHIRLSDQISNLNGSLIVVYGSNNSNFNSGNLISPELLKLSPGATIIITDKTVITKTESTVSSSTQLYIMFKVLLLCLYVIKICNL